MNKVFKFALIGSSLQHSKSPQIHQNYAKLQNFKCDYKLIEVENMDNFMQNEARKLNGFNITFPYKQVVLDYVDEISDEVKKIGSCNCVKNVNGKMIAYNSDYFGFKFYFDYIWKNKKFNNVLVFGYGGASKAVICVLKDLNVNFMVANRTLDKVDLDNKISLSEANECINDFDLIINTTSCGYNNDNILTNFALDKKQVLIDLNYNPEITPFLQTGIDCGCEVKNGLDMLIIQALVASDNWTNNCWNLSHYVQIKMLLQNKIMLIDGFMGSGKTTFCKNLTNNFIDLDSYIEFNENNSIAKIFEKQGQDNFRKLETMYFKSLIESDVKIISLGGGFSFYNSKLIQELKSKFKIVYIDTNLEQIKINVQNSNRPLANDIDNLYKQRKQNYEMLSEIKLNYIQNDFDKMLLQLVKEL